MKILLVYPQYPDTFWSFKHALKFISKKAAFPPLGLLTVAAMLPQEWEKKLVDMNTESLIDKTSSGCQVPEVAWTQCTTVSPVWDHSLAAETASADKIEGARIESPLLQSMLQIFLGLELPCPCSDLGLLLDGNLPLTCFLDSSYDSADVQVPHKGHWEEDDGYSHYQSQYHLPFHFSPSFLWPNAFLVFHN